MAEMGVEKLIEEITEKARLASRKFAGLSTGLKNDALLKMAELLIEKKDYIQAENKKDLIAGEKKGLSSAMLDRLALTDNVIHSMVQGLKEVITLPDPVGKTDNIEKRPNGLSVGRMRIPLGVIGMIYESRPNVTVDAAALCLKAGNCIVLRGGSEAICSNIALAEILQESLQETGIPVDAIQVIPSTDRDAVKYLLNQERNVDLIIPRGGEGLIRFVSENSRIPVLKHYKGVCHIFVDKKADTAKATPVILNAKTHRTGVCNALEGLLIHEKIAKSYLPQIAAVLKNAGVTMYGCKKSAAITKDIIIADDDLWGTEFLDMKLCVKIVDDYEEAKSYIDTYGSQHTEVIITEDYSLAQRFIQEIDASAVMVNASTRFNDGGQLGLGTEIGISTTKLHAYGPMGLEELTTRKFVVYGNGQVRS